MWAHCSKALSSSVVFGHIPNSVAFAHFFTFLAECNRASGWDSGLTRFRVPALESNPMSPNSSSSLQCPCAMWPLGSYLLSLGLSFLIYKMGNNNSTHLRAGSARKTL